MENDQKSIRQIERKIEIERKTERKIKIVRKIER
jgi:hypothetical protein